jgi:hypothetical protein
MADKTITLPLGAVPSWSNDLDLVDPSEAWDGTPTKVEPGAGLRDDGLLPEENPKAQHYNHLLNEDKIWIQYLGLIQAMNWLNAGPLPTSNTGQSLTYDEGIAAWVAAGRADNISFSIDSFTWSANVNSGTAQTWDFSPSKVPDDAPTHTNARTLFGARSAGQNVVVELSGTIAVPVFTPQTLPGVGSIDVDWAVWDRINSLWLVAGVEDTAGTPTIVFWSDATPITGFTKNTPAALNSTEVVHMVHGEDGIGGALNVAIGDGAAPTLDVWTSTNGTAWTRATPTGLTAAENARALLWDSARNLFVLLTDAEVYTSTNGTAWTLIRTVTSGGAFLDRVFSFDGGGLYVAGMTVTGGQDIIVFSSDGGVTWRVIAPPPTGAFTTVHDYHDVQYSRFAGRFMASYIDPAGPPLLAGDMATSLSVGETVREVDGTVIPTVT